MTDEREDAEQALPWTLLDGEAGPALPIDDQRAMQLVSAALERVAEARRVAAGAPDRVVSLAVTDTRPQLATEPPLHRRRRAPVAIPFWLAATFALLGVAMAATITVVAIERSANPNRQPAPSAPALRETAAAPPSDRPSPAVQPTAVTESPSAVAPVASPAPEAVPPRPERRTSAVSADELLQQANQLRAAHRFAEADSVYQRVASADPRGNAGTVARISAGTLKLEQLGDPSGALRLFRAALALRSAGPLAEEARWGIVEAYHALGDPRGERQAVQTFLVAHPSGVHTAAAEARLRTLGGADEHR